MSPDGGTVLAALLLVLLTRADGGTVQVAAGQITSLHAAARSGSNKVVNPGARCVIWLSDGRVLSVIEPCEEVRRLLNGGTP